jgi:uncharacterized protein (DUF1800 family)
MELFLLGVGNYTEADVEASTAAWTGHTDQWDDDVAPYRWRPEWHDSSVKTFLGTSINSGTDWRLHGPETIDVMLGAGRVPVGASLVANRGRLTREVAAEFLTKKLWTAFATDGAPPLAVRDAMRDALLAGDFDARPWVRAMLLHPDFYSDSVKSGLVRSPVEFVVALQAATGRRSADANVIWLMEGMDNGRCSPRTSAAGRRTPTGSTPAPPRTVPESCSSSCGAAAGPTGRPAARE